MYPADFLLVIFGKGFVTALATLADVFVTEGFWLFVSCVLLARFLYFLAFRR